MGQKPPDLCCLTKFSFSSHLPQGTLQASWERGVGRAEGLGCPVSASFSLERFNNFTGCWT
jgi:hypothetical protein